MTYRELMIYIQKEFTELQKDMDVTVYNPDQDEVTKAKVSDDGMFDLTDILGDDNHPFLVTE